MNDRKYLRSLIDKIENNTANYEEYIKYETILRQEKKGAILTEYGYNSMDELYKDRKKHRNDNSLSKTIGGIIGVGLAILLLWTLSEKKQP